MVTLNDLVKIKMSGLVINMSVVVLCDILGERVCVCVCVCGLGSVGTLGPIIQSAGHHGQPDHLAHCWQRVSPLYSNTRAFVWFCTSETKPGHTSSGKSSDWRFVIAAVVLTQLVTTSDTALSCDAHAKIHFYSDIRVHSYYCGFATEKEFRCHVKADAKAERVNVASGNWNKCERAGPVWSDWHWV